MTIDETTLRHVMRSVLAETGAKHLTASDGLLGNADQRKNRGRWSELSATNPVARLLDLSSDDQLGMVCYLTCGIIAAGDDSPALPMVRGVASWGTDGGAVDLVEFDFLRGTVLTLAGSSIRVTAYFDGDPSPVQVGVFASYGAKPGGYGAQRTLAVELEDEASGTLDLPRFARFARILTTEPGASIEAAWLDASAAVIAAVTSADPIALPIPQGAARLRITNNSGDALTARAIFELCL